MSFHAGPRLASFGVIDWFTTSRLTSGLRTLRIHLVGELDEEVLDGRGDFLGVRPQYTCPRD